MEMFVQCGNKKLRCGYTTGSTATAAAKAAAYILYSNEKVEFIEIDTPKGIKLSIKVNSIEITDKMVIVSVLKDGGDDIDVTDGIEIFAKAERIKDGFQLDGGEGIGIVTKEGLAIPKGQYAINPTPRKMIQNEVLKVIPKDSGIKISISIPKGVEIAKKTFNPRLGIKDGISVLGTTGIVYPMSEESLKESIKLEIKQKAKGRDKLVITFGNMGEKVAKKLGYKEEEIAIISNFVGHAIECCVSESIKNIVLVGHIGKISKVAYGCFNTHSRVADVRLEVMALELTLLGADIKLVKDILNEKTTEGAVEMLGDKYNEVYERIGEKIINKVHEYAYNEIKSSVVIYSGFVDSKVLYKGGKL